MEQPGQPHVRNFDGSTWIERVPNVWVQVCDAEFFSHLFPHERQYLIDKALKHGLEREFPAP